MFTMKNTLLASVFTMASLPVMAAKPLTNEVECMAISQTAERIMAYRQTDGNTIGPMFSFIVAATNLGEYKELTKRIVIDAFKEPSYGSDKYKAKAISEFSSEYFIDCLEAYNGEL